MATENAVIKIWLVVVSFNFNRLHYYSIITSGFTNFSRNSIQSISKLLMDNSTKYKRQRRKNHTFSSSSSSSSSSLLLSCEASSLAMQSRQSRRSRRTTSWSLRCSYGTRLPRFRISQSVTANDHTSLFVVYLPCGGTSKLYDNVNELANNFFFNNHFKLEDINEYPTSIRGLEDPESYWMNITNESRNCGSRLLSLLKLPIYEKSSWESGIYENDIYQN